MSIEEVLSNVQNILDGLKSNFVQSSSITDCLNLLKPLCSTENSLPSKLLFTLQQNGQILWNKVAWWKETNGEEHLGLRLVATYLYLLGNQMFSKTDIREAYFQFHPLEGEKCILLCIRTAKEFSKTNESETALALLSYAVSIRQCCVWNNEKSFLFDSEIFFAEMIIFKNLDQWEKVVKKAKNYFDLCKSSPSKREALINFIYLAAESPMKSLDSELHLRNLLTLSIEAQQKTFAERKLLYPDQILIGVTYMQMSLSFLRSSMFLEALQYADSSYLNIHSSEALALKAACHASLQQSNEAVQALTSLTQEASVRLDDVFAIAFMVGETDPKCVSNLLRCLKSNPLFTNQGSDEFKFYLLSFIFQFCGANGVEDVLHITSDISAESSFSYAIFNFCWEMSQIPEILLEKKILLITEALRFASSASEAEIESLLTILAQTAINAFENGWDENILAFPYSMFQKFSTITYGLFSKVTRCQLAFLMKNETEAIQYIGECYSENEINLSAANAMGSLAYFFIQHGSIALAADVGVKALSSALLPLEHKVVFLKVIALAFLHHTTCRDETSSISFIVANISDLLISETIETDFFWWCRFLWFAGDTLEPTNQSLSLELATAAGSIGIKYSEKLSVEALHTLLCRMTLLIEQEFISFSLGKPFMTREQLEMFLGFICEKNKKQSRVLFLAQSEAALRSLKAGVSSVEHIQNILSVSTVMAAGCNFEDCEAICNALATLINSQEEHALRNICAEILISAALHLQKHTPDFISSAFRALYKAYNISFDDEMHLNICFAFSNLIRSEQFSSNSGSAFLSALEDNEAQTVLEYFAVETWNSAVKHNAAKSSEKMEKFRSLTDLFSSRLLDGNFTKEILTNFMASMPVL